MNQLRLALVDGNTLLRECLAELCDIEPDLRVIGQVDGGPAAVALVRRDRPDVVLLDAETADGPVEVLHSLVTAPSAPRVVVLGVHGHTRAVRRLMVAGAHGYVSKRSTRAELLAVVRTVGARSDQVLLALPAIAVHRFGETPRGPLSPREVEVLDLVAQGLSNAQVGARLSICAGTVKRHLTNIYAKFGVHSRTNAINRAAALQIL